MTNVLQTIFLNAFSSSKSFNFNHKFTEVRSQGPNRQYANIGSDNALATSHYTNQWLNLLMHICRLDGLID